MKQKTQKRLVHKSTKRYQCKLITTQNVILWNCLNSILHTFYHYHLYWFFSLYNFTMPLHLKLIMKGEIRKIFEFEWLTISGSQQVFLKYYLITCFIPFNPYFRELAQNTSARSSWDWEIKKFTTFYLFAIRNNVIERLRINVMDCKNEYVDV